MDSATIKEIEQKLQYRFGNVQLLVQAFTHSSYAHVQKVPDNERMEFFGDAILEYLSSEYLYDNFEHCNEGELSAMRAKIISADGLAEAIGKLDIFPFLQTLDKQPSKKTCANLYEAVLCAIYLDGGLNCAKEFFLRSTNDILKDVCASHQKDSKTTLQEYCQKRKLSVTYVQVGREGPDNKPLFRCELLVDGVKQSEGEGPSKKAAEQDAAHKLVINWRIDKCYI